MQLSIILGLFILARSMVVDENNTEVSTENYPKIFNGEATSIEEIPYQVSIRLRCLETIGVGLGHICGGTLISQRAVLTAAICCFRLGHQLPRNKFQVVMGNTYLTNRSSTERKYDLADLRIHSLFEYGKSDDYNIAFLFIDGVVPSSSFIRPIGLTKSPVDMGTKCQISGWGATDAQMHKDTISSNVVLSGQVLIDNCYKVNPIYVQHFICAVYNGSNFCSTDIGGPLVCGSVLVGIMYGNIVCGQVKLPDVYLNVLLYNDWIKRQNDTFNYKYKIRTKSMSIASSFSSHYWHCFTTLAAYLYGAAF